MCSCNRYRHLIIASYSTAYDVLLPSFPPSLLAPFAPSLAAALPQILGNSIQTAERAIIVESIQAAVRNARRSRVPLNFSQLITTILDTLEKGGHTEAVRNFRRFLDFDRVKAESVLRTIVNPVQRILRHKNRRRSHVAHLKIKSKVMKRLVHSAVRPHLLGFITPLFAYSRCSPPC